MLPDSGAQVNLLPKEIYDKNCKHLPKLQPCVSSVFLCMSSKLLDTCDEFYSDIYEPVSKKCINHRLLSWRGREFLCYVKMTQSNWDLYNAPVAYAVQTDSGKLCDRLKRVHPEVFVNKPGKLNDRQRSLHIDSNVSGVIQHINQVPFNRRDKVKAELWKLMEWDIIERVDTPSEWVLPCEWFVSVSIWGRLIRLWSAWGTRYLP